MSFTATFWLNIFWLVIGYAAAIFTWQWLHTQIVGIEEKALQLRAKARDLEAKLRAR